jgi:hypothetical protein
MSETSQQACPNHHYRAGGYCPFCGDSLNPKRGSSGEREVQPQTRAQGIRGATSGGVGTLCSGPERDGAGHPAATGSEPRHSESVVSESRGGAMGPRRALTLAFQQPSSK